MNSYEILGVDQNASIDEIKKAYRKLARIYHPDVCPGDNEAEKKFKEVQNAYDDLTKRKQQAFGFNVDDIFESMFSGGRRVRKGRDIQEACHVSFMESAKGCRKQVKMKTGNKCNSCGGRGATQFDTCAACRGSGTVAFKQGNMSIRSTCRQCLGAGQQSLHPCDDCSGSGMSKDTVVIEVDIPAGIREGDSIHMPGRGEKSDVNGDAYVTIHVEKHPMYARDGDDVHVVVPITFCQAVFGSTLKVLGLDGIKEISIEPGVKTSKEIRLIGDGIKNSITGNVGDLVVNLEIDTSMPDGAAREHLAAYMEMEGISQLRQNYMDQVNAADFMVPSR